MHWVSVAGAMVDDQNRVLAIRRRDNNHWEPPGGILESDESIHDGLIREIREETDLEVRPMGLSGVYKNMTRGIIALVFRCEVISGQPGATEEAAEARFLTRGEIETLMDEAYACRLLDALHPGVAIRSHDGVDLI
jgi:ADP-ribose pyrophosphatase YjhB (NUDIX family)